MRRVPLVLVAVWCAIAVHPASAETRCGWLQNPTPGNWWLADSAGTFVLATQGAARETPGMDLIPDLTEGGFVATNGPSYGYACACLGLETRGQQVVRVLAVKQKPLSACRSDPGLPKP